jgi:two-component system, OmpR family, response regulator
VLRRSRPELILVAEDDPELRDVLCSVLAGDSLQALGVKDGREAQLFLAYEARPGLLVLDLKLPGLSGWELLDWLRRDIGLRDLPVVIISGAVREHVELALAYRPIACLRKPLDAGELLRVLQGVFPNAT